MKCLSDHFEKQTLLIGKKEAICQYIHFQHTNKELTHYDVLNHFQSFHIRIAAVLV